jgi:hypothetical protein
MSRLSTEAEVRAAFYRLVGTTSTDDTLSENAEAANLVADMCLTHGFERAQMFMIGCGMTERWRARSSAITSWSGADSTDGGRYKALSDITTDFLRFSGKKMDPRYSSLMAANGDRWGVEIDADYDVLTGNVFYLKNEQLWIGVGSVPYTTLYLDYQFRHPEFTTGVTINFPGGAIGLCVAYAALHGSTENWYPRSDNSKIAENVDYWEKQARMVARRSRGQRKQSAPKTVGTRFWA